MEHQGGILRGFLAQVESKEAEEEEAECGFVGEFLKLKSQSIKYRNDRTYPTKAADKAENVKKNRYKDIVPFDHSRVKLSLTTSQHDTDYINASFIKGVSGSRAYIATQGPLPHTVLDFLRMLWEYNIEVIVMVCREFEMGRKKCERYWPEKKEEAFVCDPFTVYCDSEESKGDHVTRTLRVTYRNWSRSLRQLQYVNWPDHGVPDSIPPILELLTEMHSYQTHEDVPICIHCSAGCGRTGALCAIDYTWNLVKTQLITEDFSIYDLVHDMRKQRPSVVQTKEQYELVYRTIKFLFEKYLQSMASPHPTSRQEVPAVPSPIPIASESDLSDLSEESGLELNQEPQPQPQPQYRLETKREQKPPQREEPGGIPNHLTPLVHSAASEECVSDPRSPSDILNAMRDRDRFRQREVQRPYLLQTLSTNLPTSQDLRQGPSHNEPIRTTPTQGQEATDRALNQVHVENVDLVPVVSNSLCLTVEDPYFGPESPLNSPLVTETTQWSTEDLTWAFNGPGLTLNDLPLELPVLPTTAPGAVVASVDEDPPPLPERTPDSYFLDAAADTECQSDTSERLEVIIPANAAAEALRRIERQRDNSGRLEVIIPANAAAEALRRDESPSSPVPALPERTPESFVLAVNEAPVEKVVQDRPAESSSSSSSSKIGMSAEWSGGSEDKPAQVEKKPWIRSKSCKVRITTSVPPPVLLIVPVSGPPPNLLSPPPPCPQTPPFSPQACDSLTPPLPERTPDSFFLVTEEVHPNSATCLQTGTKTSQRIGTSSEWAGNSQPTRFLDVVMNRSKSVRAKGSRQEPLTTVQPVAPPPVAVAGGGCVAAPQFVDNRVSTSTGTTEGPSDKSSGKGMSRTKSLFFRNKHKPKTAPPLVPNHPGPPPPTSSYGASSMFKFGFGSRFSKPKGPRSQPETWV